jgi:hypothetical protein
MVKFKICLVHYTNFTFLRMKNIKSKIKLTVRITIIDPLLLDLTNLL